MTNASATADPGGQIRSLSFLSPGNFPDNHPEEGLEDTLRLFELGEQLGFNGAWIRQRHLEHGVSSAAVFLAAASQRTRRIELGTAVIPMGYESPFRLGEDLNLLTGNIVFGEGATDFVAAQRAYISEYRRLAGANR